MKIREVSSSFPFSLGKEVMIINSKPDLVANLAFCLRYFFGVMER